MFLRRRKAQRWLLRPILYRIADNLIQNESYPLIIHIGDFSIILHLNRHMVFA